MKIILTQDVPNLGEEGDICDVANGYGRNYLVPKKFAIPFTKQNQAVIESRRDAIEKRKEEKRVTAQGLKERLETVELTVTMPAGETGKLFGSVNNATVAEHLEKNGIEIEKKRIEVPSHNIKMAGTYEIKVKLYDQQTALVKLVVNAENQGKVIQPPKKTETETKAETVEAETVEAETVEAETAEAETAEAETAEAETAEAETAEAETAEAETAEAETAEAETAEAETAEAETAEAETAEAETAEAETAEAETAEAETAEAETAEAETAEAETAEAETAEAEATAAEDAEPAPQPEASEE